MLSFWLNKLERSGLKEVFVNTHHYAELVSNEIEKFSGNMQVHVKYEEILLGTAGTLIKNANDISDSDALVIHCDNYSLIDLVEMFQFHRNRPLEIHVTMGVFKTKNVSGSGMVDFDADNRLLEFIEKPLTSNLEWANAAVYIFDKEVLSQVSQEYLNAFDIAKDLIPRLLNQIQVYRINQLHMDMGTVDALHQLNSI
jgi:mannose-1-phosphate guanylyltransferase